MESSKISCVSPEKLFQKIKNSAVFMGVSSKMCKFFFLTGKK